MKTSQCLSHRILQERMEGLNRPTSMSERLFEEALVKKGGPPFGFPTQIAKEARVVQSVRIAD